MRTTLLILSAALLCVARPAMAQAKTEPAKPAAKAKTQGTWWGHAAWVIETPGGARIAIDPWLSNPMAPKGAAKPTELDAILVSHGHSDHVGDAQALSKQTGAPIYGSFELVNLLGGGDKDVGGNVGGSWKVKDATIHMVEAVHSSGFGDDPKGPKYGGPAMGFVIQIDDGPTIYHAGDTAAFASMDTIIGRHLKPTVALLPIGGHFTMDPEAAALATRMLRVRTVVPMHYGTFPLLKGTPAQLSDALRRERSSAKVVAPKPGETITF